VIEQISIEQISPGGTTSGQARLSTLSHRELEIVKMAAEGLTNNEIAGRLDLTVHAVKFHLASIYRKLGVGNRTKAAVTYLRYTRA
jgi:DNA-binding CsgD family transcriptional regulator